MYCPVLYGEKAKVDKKLKCIIFSHGLGSYRSMYSTIYAELASRGYIVASVEHRLIPIYIHIYLKDRLVNHCSNFLLFNQKTLFIWSNIQTGSYQKLIH